MLNAGQNLNNGNDELKNRIADTNDALDNSYDNKMVSDQTQNYQNDGNNE